MGYWEKHTSLTGGSVFTFSCAPPGSVVGREGQEVPLCWTVPADVATNR